MNTVIYQDNITRKDLKTNRDKVYLFGDNLDEAGLGGQAKEMRGEPNAIGIPTKRHPSMNPKSFFTNSDRDFNEIKWWIDFAFSKIPEGVTVVVPSKGLGTGLAELPKRSPRIYNYILKKIKDLELPENPGFDSLEF